MPASSEEHEFGPRHNSVDSLPDDIASSPGLAVDERRTSSGPTTVHERLRLERLLVQMQQHSAVIHGAEPLEGDDEHAPLGTRGNSRGNSNANLARHASFVSNTSIISRTSFVNYPTDVVHLVRQMRDLTEDNLLVLEDLTQRKAQRVAAYSMLEYRGESWYLPTIRPVDEEAGEPRWGVAYDGRLGVIVSLGGQRMELHLAAYLLRVFIIALIWFTLWTMLPRPWMERGGAVFDPLLLTLLSSVLGGALARVLQIPPLICVLAVAIVFNNIPTVGYFTSGIDPKVRTIATTTGLTTILLRAGLSIKVAEVRAQLANVAALSILPAAAELVVASFVAKDLFGYEGNGWAFMHGAIVAACSPAVMVPALLAMRLKGYTTKGGPSLLMLPASPTEMVIAIWNINFTADLLYNTELSLPLAVALGPIQIVGGVLLGLLLALMHYGVFRQLMHEAKKLPHRRYGRAHAQSVAAGSFLVMLLLAGSTVFFSYSVSLAGGGSVAATVMAIAIGWVLRKNSHDPFIEEHLVLVAKHTAQFWDVAVMPALFAMVGSQIVLAEIFTADFFPKALAVLAASYATRMVIAVVCTAGTDYSLSERLMLALGWCAKASVQAALGPLALSRAVDTFAETAKTDPALAARNLVNGGIVANMAVVTILISAPMAAISLVRIGPHALRLDGEAEKPEPADAPEQDDGAGSHVEMTPRPNDPHDE
jgi:NhaP-type Na+/H+ or K+/H+ antiporter